MPRTRKNHSGFSLTETLVSLALIAILSMLVGPSFTQLHQSTQSNSRINEVANLLRLARVQALNRQSRVIFCPSTNGRDCESHWETGAMVFVDSDKNNRRSDDEALLAFKTPLVDDGTISFNGKHKRVGFSSRGFALGSAGSFIYCHTSDNQSLGRALIMNFQGRFRMGPDHNKDGIVEAGNAKNIAC